MTTRTAPEQDTPAIAHAAGRRRMGVDDWNRVNKQTPRIVDVLPNGPRFSTPPAARGEAACSTWTRS